MCKNFPVGGLVDILSPIACVAHCVLHTCQASVAFFFRLFC